MEKSMILKIEDLKASIINDISNANMPVYIIEPIIKDIYMEIAENKRRLFLNELENYNATKEENENG